MNICPDRSLPDLRLERRQLSEALTRLGWLRRLVLARTDLEVARLTAVIEGTGELNTVVRSALDPGVCGSPDLLRHLTSTTRSLDAELASTQQAFDQLTHELVRQLQHDPTSCLAPLTAPTDNEPIALDSLRAAS